MDSCKKNIPESNNMWYNAWKQTLYHRASGFRVYRENPGAQFSRRGTMSGGHGIICSRKIPRNPKKIYIGRGEQN